MIEFVIASEIVSHPTTDDDCNVLISHICACNEYENCDYLCHCKTPELARKMVENLNLANDRIMAIEWAKKFTEVNCGPD